MSIIVHLPIDILKIEKYKNNNFYEEIYKYNKECFEPSAFNEIVIHEIKENDETDELYPFINDFVCNYNDTDKSCCNIKNYNLKINDNNIILKTYLLNHEHNNIENQKFNCWWCCHSFDTEPVYIPRSYKDNIFNVYGNFCSFNCSLSYNFNCENYCNLYEQESLIHLLYKKINNIVLTEHVKINYSPKKEILKTFGGFIEIEDYRKNLMTRTYNMTFPPYNLIIPELEEIEYVKLNTNVLGTNELVLKRNKKTPINLLTHFMK